MEWQKVYLNGTEHSVNPPLKPWFFYFPGNNKFNNFTKVRYFLFLRKLFGFDTFFELLFKLAPSLIANRKFTIAVVFFFWHISYLSHIKLFSTVLELKQIVTIECNISSWHPTLLFILHILSATVLCLCHMHGTCHPQIEAVYMYAIFFFV